jgi:anti-sigma factor ChrR (cupin superfamily)
MTDRPPPLPLSRARPGSNRVATAALDWRPSESDGFATKLLFADEALQESTLLMRFGPGSYSPPHAHDQIEEILVLDGSFYDDERSYGVGDYCYRAAGAMHAAGSRDGCTVLVVYRVAQPQRDA